MPRRKLEAEAQGKEKLGLAEVHVRTADADATVKAGDAEARNDPGPLQRRGQGPAARSSRR